MINRIFCFLLLLFPVSIYSQKTYDYPKTFRSDTIDNYFGTRVSDPYRWLENIDSKQTQEWVKQQEIITDQYEKKKQSLENAIYEKLVLYSYADFKPLIKRGKLYFHYSYTDLETPPKLIIQSGIRGITNVILDPDDFKEKKNEVLSVTDFALSADNKFLVASLSKSGADWSTIRVIGVDDRKPLRDVIENVKLFDLSWKGHGFFYIRCDSVDEEEKITAKNSHPRLYYHMLGESVKSDKVIYTPPLKASNNWFSYLVTQDEKYLIVYNYVVNEENKVQRAVLYARLDSLPSITLRPFILQPEGSRDDFEVIANIGSSFLVKSDMNAPTRKILLYNPEEGLNKYREIVPRYKNVLEHVSYADGKIICLYHLRGQFMACVYNMDGKILKQIGFPQGNTVRGFEVSKGDEETFYFVNSFYFPTVAHRMDLKSLKTELVSQTNIEFDQNRFETRYVTYKSDDNTEIPMFLTYKKGLKLKDDNPVLMYGYGGFGKTLNPFFKASTIVWIENGGVFAVPGIRGGGELGSEWHHNGMQNKKFNSFDDFIAAARFLIDSNYTSHEKLSIEGGSNGGLLVGVAMTQHPELFQAVVAEMGVFDMLRYNRFSIGSNWAGEYGVSSDSLSFINLLKYSPLHNLKEGVKYPATLVITSDNDDRVPPLHSYKFLATLQEHGEESNPYLLKVNEQSGHHGSDIIKQKMETEALKCMFLFRSLKIDPSTVF